ncbi:MAG TPA: DUF2383 domain-containing protein [Bryobacteraceae bacterium]|nr:DUF2383 domain-containing protein [Bryobacteraceae bacterium]
MASAHHDVISTLNDLISTCLDSGEGFGKAAKGAHSDEWRSRFTEISGKRGGFADELAAEVRRLGGTPVTTPHFGGILRPGWVDLKVASGPSWMRSFWPTACAARKAR